MNQKYLCYILNDATGVNFMYSHVAQSPYCFEQEIIAKTLVPTSTASMPSYNYQENGKNNLTWES